jgi:hypothetical protein
MLVWHLTALVLAPLSIPPTSRLVRDLAQQPPMQWYLDGLYLNHGYHFFAPDPGAGRLVRYEVADERGGTMKQGEFPNSEVQWPRLWYHRHFMLADQAGAGPEDPADPDSWKRKYLEAYARHLLRVHDGHSARVRWIEHRPLDPQAAYEGAKLNDPSTYQTLLEVVQRRSDLGPIPNGQSNAWQSGPTQIASPWTGVTR